MVFASAPICSGQENIIRHVFIVLSKCWFLIKVLTALDFDIGVRLGVPYLQLLPPMVVGQIRVRAGLLGPLTLAPGEQVAPLRRWEGHQRREPLTLEDIRGDEEEENENGEEVEEDQKGSLQPNAVEKG